MFIRGFCFVLYPTLTVPVTEGAWDSALRLRVSVAAHRAGTPSFPGRWGWTSPIGWLENALPHPWTFKGVSWLAQGEEGAGIIRTVPPLQPLTLIFKQYLHLVLSHHSENTWQTQLKERGFVLDHDFSGNSVCYCERDTAGSLRERTWLRAEPNYNLQGPILMSSLQQLSRTSQNSHYQLGTSCSAHGPGTRASLLTQAITTLH